MRTALPAALALALMVQYASADILVLNDGSRREGIVTTSSLQPDLVIFSDHVSQSLQIPRSKIQQVIREPEAVSRLRMARALANEGKYDRALGQLREAQKLDPNNPEMAETEQLIARAMAVGESRRAEAISEESRRVFEKIRGLIEAKQFDKIEPLFASLETAPDDVRIEAAKMRFEYLSALGDFRADRLDTFGAIEAYEGALDINPEAKEVYSRLMRLYESAIKPGADQNRANKLQEYLEARVAENPKDLDARLRLANLLYARRDWNDALENYMVVYQAAEEAAATRTLGASLPRVAARVRQLMDMRHQEAAKKRDWDQAIKNFQEYQTLFPDADTEPLNNYEYMQKAQKIGPKDTDERLGLVEYAEKRGMRDQARKELATVLSNDPKNARAVEILKGWAQADLAEIDMTFRQGMYEQIAGLVNQFKQRYPGDRYPSLQALNEQADDYVERARNETQRLQMDRGRRATELAQSGDENFQRGMSALDQYRAAGDVGYQQYGGQRQNYRTMVGSYKADAILYFQRALRYYREALTLNRSLTDPANGDLNRKIADAERYLRLLTSQEVRRLPPGPRSARRFGPTAPGPYVGPGYLSGPYGNINPNSPAQNPYYNPYYNPYITQVNPYVAPVNPYYNPYGAYPYGTNPYGGYGGYPYGGTPYSPVPTPGVRP